MDVVIDTDPGVDDALALAVAARSPELNLLAVTTTHGNVSVEQAYRNAAYLLRQFGRAEVPVYQGAAAPLARPRQGAEEVHGAHGLGYARPAPPAPPPPEEPAAMALVCLARRQRYILLAIGPLTNVALALALDGEAMRAGVERIVLMGGNVQAPGNVTAVAEFNFWADPEAARQVFASGIPIEMVGLDVTRQLIFTRTQIERLGEGDPKADPFLDEIKAMLRFYVEFHVKAERLDGCVINDPLAVALLLHPEWGRALPLPVVIDCSDGPGRGQSIADRRAVTESAANCQAYLEIQAEPITAWIEAKLLGKGVSS